MKLRGNDENIRFAQVNIISGQRTTNSPNGLASVPVQIPKFAVYAIIEKPLFDQTVFRNSRKIGLLQFRSIPNPCFRSFSG